MPTHVDNLRHWFDEGKAQGKDFMIVVCDTYDYTDFPVHTTASDFAEVYAAEKSKPMQKIMEIYDLRENREMQMWEHRAWHPPFEVAK